MKRGAGQLLQTTLVVFLLFIAGVLAITGYALWRVRADALASGLDLAVLHARRFEDLLTQSLHVSELVGANIVTHAELERDPQHLAADFRSTLRRLPFLRSVSVLSGDGRIIVSSNAANVGLRVSTEDYLPAPAGASDKILRIGRPWAGRDFSTGWPSTRQASPAADAANFIPVAQALDLGERRVTLLFALNTDYFVSDLARQLDAHQGRVDVVRYDGTVLLSSEPQTAPGTWRDVSSLPLADVDSGRRAAIGANGRPALTAFRASPLYPLVVLAEIDRDYALAHWEVEARTVLGVVGVALFVVCGFGVVFYRRQVQSNEQGREFERVQRINAMVFDSSSVATLVADDRATIVSLNAEYARVTGFRPEELIGHSLFELLTPDGVALFEKKTRRRKGREPEAGGAATAGFEVEHRCQDGSLVWMEVTSTPERNANGEIVAYHRICRNITERKRMEDQVRQLAFHDTLTQLPNRRLLSDRLRKTMAASRRTGSYGALMFLDLDHFKPLNDRYGHGVGDLLLIDVARRLKNCVREADTVARFGGDEFVVMLGALSTDRAESTQQATLIAEKIRGALSEPYRLESGTSGRVIEHRSSASIGVVLFIGHEASVDDLLRWADAAMYQAKEAGPSRIRFHEPAAA